MHSSHDPAITIDRLSKHFQVPTREAGLKAAVVSLFHRTHKTVKAVDEISFTIQPGEVVGFLGPNGAGKTTTLKMLSGLLHSTSGSLRVLDYEPQRREKDFLSQITLVMGNRNQLAWDLPAIDSFRAGSAIYAILQEQYRRTRDELIDLLELAAW
jgi:ABC-2 type transport system ATP-binding protein